MKLFFLYRGIAYILYTSPILIVLFWWTLVFVHNCVNTISTYRTSLIPKKFPCALCPGSLPLPQPQATTDMLLIISLSFLRLSYQYDHTVDNLMMFLLLLLKETYFVCSFPHPNMMNALGTYDGLWCWGRGKSHTIRSLLFTLRWQFQASELWKDEL